MLVSWAVPKGPTLDPDVRRGRLPRRGPSDRVLRLRGRHPGRRVRRRRRHRVGRGHVGAAPRTADPGSQSPAARLHCDLSRREAARPLRARTDQRPDGSGQGASGSAAQARRVRGRRAGTPRTTRGRCSVGRTNDEVKADPDRLWRSDLPPARAAVALRPPAVDGPSPDELASWTSSTHSPGSGAVAVFGRELRVTNLDKVLFPARAGEDPVTKRELLRYAAQIAPTVLPYLARRALNLHRFPNGARPKGFWHKELPAPRTGVAVRAGTTRRPPGARHRRYLVVDEPAALVWAANFGALEWHAWTSRVDQPAPADVRADRPRPGATRRRGTTCSTWPGCTAPRSSTSASWPGAKVTGRRGIQIWVPIAAGPDFDDTRAWVEQLSRPSATVVPELVSWKWQKSTSAAGLARLDYTQNAINKTLVAPYSPRPAAGAPVSAPIDWDELDDPEPASGRLHDPDDRGPRRGEGRPVPRRTHPPADAAAPAVTT